MYQISALSKTVLDSIYNKVSFVKLLYIESLKFAVEWKSWKHTLISSPLIQIKLIIWEENSAESFDFVWNFLVILIIFVELKKK